MIVPTTQISSELVRYSPRKTYHTEALRSNETLTQKLKIELNYHNKAWLQKFIAAAAINKSN